MSLLMPTILPIATDVSGTVENSHLAEIAIFHYDRLAAGGPTMEGQ
jgi:hypothetical protein